LRKNHSVPLVEEMATVAYSDRTWIAALFPETTFWSDTGEICESHPSRSIDARYIHYTGRQLNHHVFRRPLVY
jgi:hypothetical protein